MKFDVEKMCPGHLGTYNLTEFTARGENSYRREVGPILTVLGLHWLQYWPNIAGNTG